MMASAEPVQNVDRSRHGNLAAAQELIAQAFARISDAQAANDSRLGGHAAQAKQLLEQAATEVGLAAETADNRGGY
jgi:hypothetical protein